MESKICCVCGKEFTGYGNNAQPIVDGICCDECNNLVILRRMELALSNYKGGEK